jgi:hypothetical protein
MKISLVGHVRVINRCAKFHRTTYKDSAPTHTWNRTLLSFLPFSLSHPQPQPIFMVDGSKCVFMTQENTFWESGQILNKIGGVAAWKRLNLGPAMQIPLWKDITNNKKTVLDTRKVTTKLLKKSNDQKLLRLTAIFHVALTNRTFRGHKTRWLPLQTSSWTLLY